jgi:hypothetical protein
MKGVVHKCVPEGKVVKSEIYVKMLGRLVKRFARETKLVPFSCSFCHGSEDFLANHRAKLYTLFT